MSFYDMLSRRKRGALAIFIGIFLVLLAIPFFGEAAGEFDYNVDTTYHVDSNATTRVEENYLITNNTASQYLDKMQISTPVDDAKNISVEYSDGTSIPFTVTQKTTDQQGYNYNYIEIDIQFTRNNAGKNTRWSFVVSYDTNKLVETKGSAHTVNIPAAPQDGDSQYTTAVFVPETYGTLHTRGPIPTSLGTNRGQTGYRFDSKAQLAKSSALVFGDSTIFEANFNFPLKNDSTATSTFTITLPPNTSGQKIIVQKLNPEPKSTRLDAEGNILADYDVPAKTNITVTTNVSAVVSYIEYNLSASGTKTDIPKDLVDKYTGSQQYWPTTDAAIAAKARELTAGKATVAEQVKAINDYVVTHLTYNNEKIKYNIRQGGLKALQNPNNAVCLEYSDLTISLLRAAGIPARMPVGYGYSGSLKQSNSVTDSLHSWVQAYVPNIGWMNIDPTWNEKFNNFGSSDLDHFAFAIWGTNDSSPAPVMQNGKDTNYQYENTTISYQSVPPVLQPSGQLGVQKWLLLPFVAINQYAIQAPATTAGDNFVIRARQGSKVDFIELGSLAPKQKTNKLTWVLGATAFGSVNADFAQSSDISTILATSKVAAQSWPMWLLLGLLAGIIILKMVKSRFTKNKKQQAIKSTPIPTVTKTQNEQHQPTPAKKE